MKSLADCKLYAFVDTAYLHGRAPEVLAQQLCDGGADLIQLRAKQSPPDEVRRLAEAIAPVTRRANVGLVINDHLAVARDVGAELCHLGQEDFFDAGHRHVSEIQNPKAETQFQNHALVAASRQSAAIVESKAKVRGALPRRRYGVLKPAPEIQIGLSTHAPDQAQRALAAGPAYIAIGPVYPTGTKPTAKAVTLEYVRWAAANVTLPWFAIGGINLPNLDAVLAAGARRICVVSAILNAPDVAQACREFRRRLD